MSLKGVTREKNRYFLMNRSVGSSSGNQNGIGHSYRCSFFAARYKKIVSDKLHVAGVRSLTVSSGRRSGILNTIAFLSEIAYLQSSVETTSK